MGSPPARRVADTCLQVSQLQSRGRLRNDLGGLFQGPRRLLLSFRGDDLKEGEMKVEAAESPILKGNCLLCALLET